MSYEVWRETGSGETWAVELEGGHIVGCRGPLHRSETRPGRKRFYDYSSERTRAVEERDGDFETLTGEDRAVLAGSVD
jgi:hypothetical protein